MLYIEDMDLFDFRPAKGKLKPIVLSVPHAGTYIPENIGTRLPSQMWKTPVDTDWYVHELYAPLAEAGITCIFANHSRFVIDLNRDRANHRLYTDGRPESTLVPTHTFMEEPLYSGHAPDANEIAQRIVQYYDPYYNKIEEQLGMLRRQFAHVLFYDGHSIKRHVPSIRKDPFPDMILGNQSGKTCDARIMDAAFKHLTGAKYRVQKNDPFSGGFLTRHFGKPAMGIHALQLEMSQDLYMNEMTRERLQPNFATLSKNLVQTVLHLADVMEQL